MLSVAKSSSKVFLFTLTLVLIFISIINFSVLTAYNASNELLENVKFQVFLTDSVKQNEFNAFVNQLKHQPFIKHVKFTNKYEAAKKLQEELHENFTTFLGYNPLLNTLHIKFYSYFIHLDSLEQFQKHLTSFPIVSDVTYHKDSMKLMSNLSKNAPFIFIVGIGIFLIIGFSVIKNTIFLSLSNFTDFIKILSISGASNSYIIKYFLIKYTYYAVISSFISSLFICSAIIILKLYVPIFSKYDIGLYFIILIPSTFIIALLITSFSTFLNTRQILKIKN